MQRTNIYLDDDQLRLLKHLAAEDDTSVADLVRRALDLYLAGRLVETSGWQERWDQLLIRIRSRLPKGVSPEGIEEDIRIARAEARRERHARRH